MNNADSPAFARPFSDGTEEQDGLTKREYAAIKIAAGMYASLSDAMVRKKFGDNLSYGMAAISADAVQATDALLVVLAKEKAQ